MINKSDFRFVVVWWNTRESFVAHVKGLLLYLIESVYPTVATQDQY